MKKVYQWVIVALVLIIVGFIVWTSTGDKISGTILIIYLLTILIVGRFLTIKKSTKTALIVGVNFLFFCYLFIKFLS